MSTIYTVLHDDWEYNFPDDDQKNYANAVESGKVLYFPNLLFSLSDAEKKVLSESSELNLTAKNISYNASTHEIKGMKNVQNDIQIALKNINARFYDNALSLLSHLFPLYAAHLIPGMTSLRPVEIQDRPVKSIKKDDTRLHVDAFPSRPNQGKRILRVFSNINFEGRPRVWRVGEPMQAVCNHFFPRLRNPIVDMGAVYEKLKITKGYRTRYDSYMLQLHDLMKMDQHYQDTVAYEEVAFNSGSTWVVFTDAVSHAALSGQHMMEQTFYLPVERMQQPSLSPLKVLEKIAGRGLVK